ncbi:MAG TPA: MOSC domain-containing protein [Terriglobales bacterium]|nr:MOSC domain-containing protein [Terriglobales bacterium]
MAYVAALYRYPVKGFNPERCEALTVLGEGRVSGDRVLGIRFADTEAPDDAWSRKTGMLALVNTPGLARLHVQFNKKELRLRIKLGDAILIEEVLNDQGRKRIADALAEYVLKLDENALSGHPERFPLRVVGDGTTPRYHDSEAGQITLHGRGSLQAVAAALSVADVSEIRFRSNIAVEGLRAWEEQTWVGKKLLIGAVEFDVVRPKFRCLATHANPKTGERDLAILPTLIKVFRKERPTFAVALVPSRSGGQIHVGDQVALID